MPRNPLRAKLSQQQTTCGLWVTMECPHITEIAVMLGLDWVVVDMEHGHLSLRDVLEHIRVVRGTQTAALVRVPEIQQATIKRVLDIGAHGLIVPLVRSATDVMDAMRQSHYPPSGVRSVGGERAVKWGLGSQDYLDCADEEILVIPLIETREAIKDIDAILAVEGLEVIFFGPADLSASYGYLGEWEGPGIADTIQQAHQKAQGNGIAAGIMARNIPDSNQRCDQGFKLIGLGADASLMIRALQESLAALGRTTEPQLWF